MKNASKQNLGRNGFSLIEVTIFATVIGNIVAGAFAYVSSPSSRGDSEVAQVSSEVAPEQSDISSLQVDTTSEVLTFVQSQTAGSTIKDITFELCATIDSADSIELDGEFDWFRTTTSSDDIVTLGENLVLELQGEDGTEIGSSTTDQLDAGATDAPLNISSWW